MSKVKRGKADFMSMPTVDMTMPMKPEMSPLLRDLKETLAMDTRPKRPTRKYSAGWKRSATLAAGGATRMRTRALSTPPTTEAKVETRTAWTALPRMVISQPSMAVAAEAEVPGARKRMAENDPPYMPAA